MLSLLIRYSNPFRIRIFLFLSYSFGIETINTFIHSRSSLENHTRFKTKIGEVYTPFQTRTAQKSYPMGRWGGTYLYSLYKGVSSPPPRAGYCCYLWHWWKIAFWLLRCRWKNVTQSFEEFWLNFPLSHGGYIWSDMSGETLWTQVTCVSYHVNNNYQHWITGKVFCCQVDIFLMFSTSNRNQSSKKSLLV